MSKDFKLRSFFVWSQICYSHFDSGTCVNNHPCNCRQNDANWRTDEGNIEEKTDLPVTKFAGGDTGGAGEQSYWTLGAMYCKGQESSKCINDSHEAVVCGGDTFKVSPKCFFLYQIMTETSLVLFQ